MYIFTLIIYFLKYIRTYILQTSGDGVKVLLKKHGDFEMAAAAHDEKIRALCEQASRLIQALHYDSTG